MSGIYGTCSIITWVTKNKVRQFLDMVTMSDIAHTVAVVENSYKAWDAEHEEKEKGEEEDSVIAEGDQQQWKTAVKSKFTGQGGRNESATSWDGVTRGLSSTREYMNVGVSYQKRVNTIHGLCYKWHGLHT